MGDSAIVLEDHVVGRELTADTVTFWPPIRTSPVLGWMKPPIDAQQVDLPQPLGR